MQRRARPRASSAWRAAYQRSSAFGSRSTMLREPPHGVINERALAGMGEPGAGGLGERASPSAVATGVPKRHREQELRLVEPARLGGPAIERDRAFEEP